MKKRTVTFILCALLTFGLVGCGKTQATDVDTDDTGMAEPETTEEVTETPTATETEVPMETETPAPSGETITTADGKYQVTVPSGWAESEDVQDDMMTLELQGPSDDQYAGFMVIDKASVEGMDISSYMDKYMEGISANFDSPEVSEKYPMDVNGNQAFYVIFTGRLDNVAYTSWAYAIDAGDNFYIATASAYPTNSEATEVAFQEMVYTFGPVGAVPTTQE